MSQTSDQGMYTTTIQQYLKFSEGIWQSLIFSKIGIKTTPFQVTNVESKPPSI